MSDAEQLSIDEMFLQIVLDDPELVEIAFRDVVGELHDVTAATSCALLPPERSASKPDSRGLRTRLRIVVAERKTTERSPPLQSGGL